MTTDLITRLHAELVALGDTADAIADRLRAKGIKGLQQDDYRCPIAHLIRTLGVEEVAVCENAIQFLDNDCYGVEIATPEAIEQFIQNFDGGMYLDLVDLDGGDRA